MDSTFVLHGNKSAHFSSSSEFASGPPRELDLMQILGGLLAKILTANHFLFFKTTTFTNGQIFHSFFVQQLLFIPASPP
jgi:hypothetical protein